MPWQVAADGSLGADFALGKDTRVPYMDVTGPEWCSAKSAAKCREAGSRRELEAYRPVEFIPEAVGIRGRRRSIPYTTRESGRF